MCLTLVSPSHPPANTSTNKYLHGEDVVKNTVIRDVLIAAAILSNVIIFDLKGCSKIAHNRALRAIATALVDVP